MSVKLTSIEQNAERERKNVMYFATQFDEQLYYSYAKLKVNALKLATRESHDEKRSEDDEESVFS